MDSQLEQIWWDSPVKTWTTLPATSTVFLSISTNPTQIVVQLQSQTVFLPKKWRAILTTIDLCQFHSLHFALEGEKRQKLANKLVHIYDQLRLHIIDERLKNPRDEEWMPHVVHRFMVRIVNGIGHRPAEDSRRDKELRNLYEKTIPFSYGMYDVQYTCLC